MGIVMKKYLLLILVIFSVAQNQKFQLSGNVIDAETNKPLEYVNIYLSNTSLGSSTLSDGSFIINNISSGEYLIYFSCIGYEPFITSLTFTKHSILLDTIKMKVNPINLQEITIEAPKPTEWQKHLITFTSLLLGGGNNSNECQIINPEAIEFEETNNIIKVKIPSLLKIKNKALGYKLLLDIKDFEWDSNLLVKYLCIPYLSESTEENEDIIKKIYNLRKATYNGSLRHFFVSLINNRLNEEGFRIIPFDYVKMKELNDRMQLNGVELAKKLPAEILKKETDYLYRIQSKDGYYVLNINNSNDPAYSNFARLYNYPCLNSNQQLSIIQFKSNFFGLTLEGTQFQNGYYYDLGGYWAFKGMSDFLPSNYNYNETFEEMRDRFINLKPATNEKTGE